MIEAILCIGGSLLVAALLMFALRAWWARNDRKRGVQLWDGEL